MTQADDHREVARLEAVAALAAVEVVVGEAAGLAEPAIGEGVEEQAVFAGDVIEPVVLRVAGRLPAFVVLG